MNKEKKLLVYAFILEVMESIPKLQGKYVHNKGSLPKKESVTFVTLGGGSKIGLCYTFQKNV